MKIPVLLILIVSLGALIRIPYLAKFPPSLYSDEVSQGYNAYSILKTGRDEFGTFLPISLRSFGDWKPPLPTYLMIPTIAIFGLNAWGVRLPSAILGSLTIVLTFYLTREIVYYFAKQDSSGFAIKYREKISLISAFLVSISPWHILQSRAAMLVVISSFLIYLGIWAFFKGLNRPKYWYMAGHCFSLAIYAYYGMRVIVPVLLAYVFLGFRKQIVNESRKALAAICFSLILLLPLGIDFYREPNVILGRAKTVSIFYDRGVELTVWDLIAQDGLAIPPIVAQFFHYIPYGYGVDIVRRFFQHFDGRFLFLIGDLHPPFQIPGMGVIFIGDGIFMILGSYILLKTNPKLLRFLFSFMAISIVPAALTFLTPSSNRTLTLLLPLFIVVSCGIVGLTLFVRRHLVKLAIVGIYLVSFIYFTYQYVYVLPKNHADWWHYGYKELVEYLTSRKNDYDTITVSGQASVPYIFFLFYSRADPTVVQKTIERDYTNDEFGFKHVAAYGMYQFPRYFKWETDERLILPGSLLAVTADQKVGERAREIKQIFTPNGKVIFKVYEVNI